MGKLLEKGELKHDSSHVAITESAEIFKVRGSYSACRTVEVKDCLAYYHMP